MVADAAFGRGDDRQPARHRLQQDQAEGLGDGSEDEGVAVGVEVGELRFAVEKSHEGDVGRGRGLELHLLWACPREDQVNDPPRHHRARLAERLDHDVDPLLGGEPAHVEEGESTLHAQLAPERLASPPRVKHRGVHSPPPHLHIADA